MSYVSDHALYGLGVIQPEEWTASATAIRPKTDGARYWFKYLQAMANKAAPRFKLKTISEDAVIGGNTLFLVQGVVGGFNTFTMPETLAEIAANAKEIGDDIADNLKIPRAGAPVMLAKTKTPSPPPPVVDQGVQQAGLGGIPIKWLLIGGGIALVLWLKKKSAAPSAAPKGV